MNSLLLTLGVAILLILAAAIAAPFFLDWSSQRGFFEAQASRLLGQTVEIDGDIDVTLLPEPRFEFQDVTIGEAGSDQSVTAGSIAIRLVLGELLKGRVEIDQARVGGPAIKIIVEENGRLGLPSLLASGEFDPTRFAAEAIEFAGGAVTIVDRARNTEITLDQINGVGTARALSGPYKFEGGFRSGGRRFDTRFATGSRDGDAIPATLAIAPTDFPLSADLEGRLALSDGVPSFEGEATAEFGVFDDESGRFTPFWKTQGPLSLTVDRLLMRDAEITIGPADRELKFAGLASMPWSTGNPLDIVLSARQLDLDRFFGTGPDDPATPVDVIRALDLLARAISGSAVGGRDISLGLDATALVLGADIVQNFSTQIDFVGSDISISDASARLPGSTDVTLSGRVGAGEDLFDGALSVQAVNIAQALRWVSADAISTSPDAARAMAGLSFSSDLTIRSNGFSLDNLAGDLQGAPFNVGLNYVAPETDMPGTLKASVVAEEFALPDLPLDRLLSRGDSNATPISLWLDRHLVDATVKIETLRTAETIVRGVDADLTVADEKVDIRQLKIDRVLGASLVAEGSIVGWPSSPEGSVSIDLRAEQLDQLYPALSTISVALTGLNEDPSQDPGDNRPDLNLYEPFQFKAEIGAGLEEEGARLSFKGTSKLAESDLAFEVESQLSQGTTMDRFLALDATLSNGGSLALLRQLGFEPLDQQTVGLDSIAGELSLRLNGIPSEGMEAQIQGRILDLDFFGSGSGDLATGFGEQASFDLEMALETADHRAFAQYLGLPAAQDLRRSGAFEGRLMLDNGTLRASPFSGRFAGTAIAGELALEDRVSGRAVTGELNFDRLDLRALAGLFYGPSGGLAGIAARVEDQVFGSDDELSNVPLGTYALSEQTVDVAVGAGQIVVTKDITVRAADMQVRSKEGRISFDDFRGQVLNGRVSASMEISPSANGLASDIQARLIDGDVAQVAGLVTPDAETLNGDVTLDLQVEGQGSTVQAIIGSMTGEGRFEVGNVSVQNLNPGAFPLVVRASDAGLPLDGDEVRRVFESHLDAGRLEIERAEGAFSVVGGVARVSNVVIDGSRASVRLSGAADFAERELAVALSLAPSGSGVIDNQTEVSVRYAGPFQTVERSVDVDGLVGYLNIRRFEQEVEKVETLQADILERQRLSREIVRHNQQLAAIEAAEAAALARQRTEESETEPSPQQPNRSEGNGSFEDGIRSVLGDGTPVPLPPPVNILPDNLTIQ